MSKFKVGDRVRVREDADRSADGKRYRGEEFVIRKIDDHGNSEDQFFSAEGSDHGIWLSEVELVETGETAKTVTKRVEINIKDNELSVRHMTNTKKNRVTMMHHGSKVGRFNAKDIDRWIELLTKLKEEV